MSDYGPGSGPDPMLPGNAARILERSFPAAPIDGVIEGVDEPQEVAVPEPPGCPHLPSDRRLIDGEQVCVGCGETIPGERQAIMPRDRPGTVDPTMREGSERAQGGLRHITWDPANPAASRPYTPEEVELELVDTLDRIERGAGYLTTKEEQRSAAKLAYELAFARARYTSEGRTVAEREDDALIQCRDVYSDWQLLDLACRTSKEGLHNLRVKANVLQSILASIREALRGSNAR
jgi:hypothetical protein